MDWLDDVISKFTGKINNLSLKKALTVYIIFSLIAIIILIAVTQRLCESWESLILTKNEENILEGVNDYFGTLLFHYDYSKLSKTDRFLLRLIRIIQDWSTVIYSLAGIIGVSYFYYNNKLREPLRLLAEAAEKVGNNDLDIEIYYNNKDEMGKLCSSFDAMRRQLIANNQRMWDMMEEQKRINAVFAHDLRTPLTVLRGYIDLLNRYLPEGQISEEKLISTLALMSDHVRRLENYSNTMKEINSLGELSIRKKPITGLNLTGKIKEMAQILNGKNGISIAVLTDSVDECQLLVDEIVFMEVFDNLISNALRYAESKIEIILALSEDRDKLMLSVSDDGKGFSQTDLNMATKAYYTDGKDKNSEHFGIGLYICKLLCEKHGGYITLENGMNKGAVVTVVFNVEKNQPMVVNC